jgi:hypothetical protein
VYEITAAIQSDRKSGSPKGAHGDPFAVLGREADIDVFTAPAISVICNLFC